MHKSAPNGINAFSGCALPADEAPMASPTSLLELDTSAVGEEAWHELLRSFEYGNIWQNSVYGQARWGTENIEHGRLIDRGKVVAAAMVALTKIPALNISVAYVQFGPVLPLRESPANSLVLRDFLQQLRAHYVEERGMLLWIRPRVAMGADSWPENEFADAGFTRQPFRAGRGTYALDLRCSLADLRANMSKSWRRNLKRALRRDFEFSCGSGKSDFNTFFKLYDDLTVRKNLHTTPETRAFKEVCMSRPDSAGLEVCICSVNGEPLAGVIVSSLGDTGMALMSATSRKARELRAGYALDWWCVQRLRSAGMRWYDLSGDQTAGVNEYKSGLTGTAGQVCFPGPFVAGGGYVSRGLFFALRAMVRKVEQYR